MEVIVGLITPPNPLPMNNRNQREAEDQQQEPRAEFAERDQVPALDLAGIEPDFREGAEIFSHPDEEGGEKRRQQKRHAAPLPVDLKMDRRRQEDDDGIGEQEIAQIVCVVVREEIHIDQHRQHPEMDIGGKPLIGQMQIGERARYVAAHRRIEKPGEQRHGIEREQGVLDARI